MRRWILSLGMGGALVACLAIGAAVSAGAATLRYSGSLTFYWGPPAGDGSQWYRGGVVAPGGGIATVNGSAGGAHLDTMALAAGAFGPVSASLPYTTAGTINSIIFTSLANVSGTLTISGGGVAGALGLSGTAKICLVFAPCNVANTTIPLDGGFGIGGTQVVTGPLSFTMQHSPWQLGTPTVTMNLSGARTWTPILPGGFAHGPASLTSSTAQPSGVVQLVTVSKSYASLTTSYPTLLWIGVLNIHFVPEPSTALLLAVGVAGLAVRGRRWRKR